MYEKEPNLQDPIPTTLNGKIPNECAIFALHACVQRTKKSEPSRSCCTTRFPAKAVCYDTTTGTWCWTNRLCANQYPFTKNYQNYVGDYPAQYCCCAASQFIKNESMEKKNCNKQIETTVRWPCCYCSQLTTKKQDSIDVETQCNCSNEEISRSSIAGTGDSSESKVQKGLSEEILTKESGEGSKSSRSMLSKGSDERELSNKSGKPATKQNLAGKSEENGAQRRNLWKGSSVSANRLKDNEIRDKSTKRQQSFKDKIVTNKVKPKSAINVDENSKNGTDTKFKSKLPIPSNKRVTETEKSPCRKNVIPVVDKSYELSSKNKKKNDISKSESIVKKTKSVPFSTNYLGKSNGNRSDVKNEKSTKSIKDEDKIKKKLERSETERIVDNEDDSIAIEVNKSYVLYSNNDNNQLTVKKSLTERSKTAQENVKPSEDTDSDCNCCNGCDQKRLQQKNIETTAEYENSESGTCTCSSEDDNRTKNEEQKGENRSMEVLTKQRSQRKPSLAGSSQMTAIFTENVPKASNSVTISSFPSEDKKKSSVRTENAVSDNLKPVYACPVCPCCGARLDEASDPSSKSLNKIKQISVSTCTCDNIKYFNNKRESSTQNSFNKIFIQCNNKKKDMDSKKVDKSIQHTVRNVVNEKVNCLCIQMGGADDVKWSSADKPLANGRNESGTVEKVNFNKKLIPCIKKLNSNSKSISGNLKDENNRNLGTTVSRSTEVDVGPDTIQQARYRSLNVCLCADDIELNRRKCSC